MKCFNGCGVKKNPFWIDRKLNNIWKTWKINTSNAGKLSEFRAFGLDMEATSIDLEEPLSDPYTIINYKATQAGEGILVEDTSVDVEGADIGVMIRWKIDTMTSLINSKTVISVLFGVLHEGFVYVYNGTVHGTISEPRGSNGFGFDPWFLPEGANKTLGEEKPRKYSARALGIDNIMSGKYLKKMKPIYKWDGEFQKS
jgi:XTP/dITP diphosphohydrolase